MQAVTEVQEYGGTRFPRGTAVISLLGVSCLLCSCETASTAGKVAATTGKVAWKATGTVVKTTGQAAGAGFRLVTGRHLIHLEREGNSFYVQVRVNRKHKTRLLLDTGASSVQVSPGLVRRMGLDISKGQKVRCTLADGSVTEGRAIVLDEVRAGRAKARNVTAVVLPGDDKQDTGGLLGMSYLDHFIFQMDTDRNILILKHKKGRD